MKTHIQTLKDILTSNSWSDAELSAMQAGIAALEKSDQKTGANLHLFPGGEMVLETETHTVPVRGSKSKRVVTPLATESAVVTEAKRLGLTESDGLWIYSKWEGSGWMNGRQPIKNWRSVMRTWFHGGWFPSQQRERQKQERAAMTQDDRRPVVYQ